MTQGRSRRDLLAFLDYCKDKGLLKASTAEARKAAVNQVLAVLSEDEAHDVLQIDIDNVVVRFQNMHGKRYTPDSLKTYKARVKGAITDFISYLTNPMDFRPKVSAGLKKPKLTRTTVSTANEDHSEQNSSKDASAAVKTTSAPLLTTSTFPIPLRPELTILVHGIPFDLTEAEARKIGNVIAAMATPS